jgi:hypothetical protein
MQIVGPGRGNRKSPIVSLHEARQECVAFLHAADAGQSQFVDQPVLQRPIHPLDATHGLAGICTENLDV